MSRLAMMALVAVICLTAQGDVSVPKRIAAFRETYDFGEDICFTDFDIFQVTQAATEFEVECWTEVDTPRRLGLVVSPTLYADGMHEPFWLPCDQTFPVDSTLNRRLRRYRFTVQLPYGFWQGYLVLLDEEGAVTGWTVPVIAVGT